MVFVERQGPVHLSQSAHLWLPRGNGSTGPVQTSENDAVACFPCRSPQRMLTWNPVFMKRTHALMK